MDDGNCRSPFNNKSIAEQQQQPLRLDKWNLNEDDTVNDIDEEEGGTASLANLPPSALLLRQPTKPLPISAVRIHVGRDVDDVRSSVPGNTCFLIQFVSSSRPRCFTCLRCTTRQFCIACMATGPFIRLRESLQCARKAQQKSATEAAHSLDCKKVSSFIVLQSKVEGLRANIDATRRRVGLKTAEMQARKEKLAYMHQRRKECERSLRHLQNGLESWQSAIAQKEERSRRKRDSLTRQTASLRQLRIRLSSDHISSIFPLGLVSDRETRSGDETLADALAEATLTTFQNGRWMFCTSGSHFFKVAGCRVPDCWDYQDLKEWLYRKKQTNQLAPPDLNTLNTLAGQAYTAHLLDVMARIYDVSLPFTVSFKSMQTLEGVTEEKLDTLLLQLSANVCVFCFSQGLSDVNLSLSRPLRNLFTFSQNLRSSGHTQPFQVPLAFVNDFCAATKDLKWTVCEVAPDVTYIAGESEWEQVSEELPSWSELPHSSTLTSLITSATSSVTHLFRAT